MLCNFIPDHEMALLCLTVYNAMELAQGGFWTEGYWHILAELERVEEAEGSTDAPWSAALRERWRQAAAAFVLRFGNQG